MMLPLSTLLLLQPRSTRLCDDSDEGVMKVRLEDMEKLGVAGFMTEW